MLLTQNNRLLIGRLHKQFLKQHTRFSVSILSISASSSGVGPDEKPQTIEIKSFKIY